MAKHSSGTRRRPVAEHRPNAAAAPISRSRSWLAPAAIVAGALVVRLVVLAQLGGHPLLQPRGVLDDAASVRLAGRVASGDVALARDVYYLAPLYTYFLGLIFALTSGSLVAARAIQGVLGAGTVALVMATATEWWGRRAGLIAGVLSAVTGLLAFNEILILQSSLDPFLTALAMFALARAVRAPSGWRFLGAGGALGALALNRPNALLVIVVVAAVWLAVGRSRQAAFDVAALGLGVLMLVAPVAARNRIVAGEWVLITSHGGLNYYIGNNAKSDGTWRATEGVSASIEGQKDDVRKVAAAALGRPVTSGEASSYFYGLAWKWIRENPARWAALQLRKLALTFNAVDVGLNVSYTYFARDERSFLSLLVVGPWLIIPLGLFGLILPVAGGRARYLAWACVVPAYAVSVAAFFVSSRYRLPLMVPLLATAGAAVDWLWTRLSSVGQAAGSRTERVGVVSRGLASAAAALVGLAVFVNWPISADNGRMFEREERVVQLIMSGEPDEAKHLLAETEARHPNRAVLFYRVGLAFKDRGQPAEAATYLQQALALNPSERWIRFNLGEALLQARRSSEAIPFLEEAGAAGVDAPTVTYDLAAAYLAERHPDRAREKLASIPLTPDIAADSLLRFGTAAMKLEDLDLARKFVSAAVQRAPASAPAHELLGVVLALQREPAQAIGEFETALRLDPSNGSASFHAAAALAEVGRFPEARAAAERAVRLRPDDPAARDLLRRLSGQ